MSIISQNLKFLRKRSGLTQEQMAVKVGIKRSLLGAYEEGRADPRLNNLLRFSEIFGVSVDTLIGRDLTQSDPLSAIPTGKDENQKMKILALTVDANENENIEIVHQKAAAGYLNGYADPEYLEELPKFQLPILPKNATYRAFEISGDSMLPISSGSIVIGKYLESLDDIKIGETYVLVTQSEGVVYKRIYKSLEHKHNFLLVSDNDQYSPYEIPKSDVLEVWEATAFISMDLAQPLKKEEVSVQKLASMVMDLQKEVAKLKRTSDT